MSVFRHRCADSAQNASGASVYQIKALVGSVKPRCFFLQIQKKTLRHMQIVESVNLCNIQPVHLLRHLPMHISLVSRHMIGIDPRIGVLH